MPPQPANAAFEGISSTISRSQYLQVSIIHLHPTQPHQQNLGLLLIHYKRGNMLFHNDVRPYDE